MVWFYHSFDTQKVVIKSMKSKQNKKPITWPKTKFFTFDDLKKLNPEPDYVDITLRVNLSKIVKETKQFTVIGSKPSPIGRPKTVYSVTPVTPEILEEAKNSGVTLEYQTGIMPIVSVSNVNSALTPSLPSDLTSFGAKNKSSENIHA